MYDLFRPNNEFGIFYDKNNVHCLASNIRIGQYHIQLAYFTHNQIHGYICIVYENKILKSWRGFEDGNYIRAVNIRSAEKQVLQLVKNNEI